MLIDVIKYSLEVKCTSVRRKVFLGGQTIFWTGQNTISTLIISNFQFKAAILYLKFHKCQIPGPGKSLVLPIGADAHG